MRNEYDYSAGRFPLTTRNTFAAVIFVVKWTSCRWCWQCSRECQ